MAASVFADAQEKEPTLAEAKAAFTKADRALNEAWSAAKAAVAPRALGHLTLSQREWLEYRDGRARHESEGAGENDPKRSAVYHSTAAALTEDRAQWLRGRARRVETDETLTGLWIDSYGGTLRLVQRERQLFFALDVVRGPTYHTGGLAGVVSWNGRLGWFSDKGREPDKTEEANLALVDRDGALEIIGANTGHYHGARAYFDGIYCKVGMLDAKDHSEVIKAAESGEMPEPKE